MTMRLHDLLRDLTTSPVDPALVVDDLVLDSRQARPGSVFVALPGERTHGLAHAREALARGAVAVLHDPADTPDAELARHCIAVPSMKEQLASLAARLWGRPMDRLELLAVTGTNGKSSVAWLLARALHGAMLGTLGAGAPERVTPARHTTPDLLSLYRTLHELAEQGHASVVMEASSHALHQRRLDGLEFVSTIFTTLGRDHLDYHHSVEAYAEAKARLFFDFPARRRLVNVDDDFGRTLAGRLAGDPGRIRYALDNAAEAEVRGRIVHAGLDGLALTVQGFGAMLELKAPLIGRVNAWNLLIVAAELLARELPLPEIEARVAALTPVPGRMQRVDGPNGRAVIIDYAHTPDALQNALATLRPLVTGRLICVFGCGGERDAGKRPEMGRIAEALADRVILTNDNPRGEDPARIIRQIQSGMHAPERATVIPDRFEAICTAIAHSHSGDCVLVAGKGHERIQDLGSRVIEFSDLDAARQALEVAA
ncbi:MAG: UDP-N-acetylmuramoyl-L-alanyl-D-glutamate--2,6-diaminopimelate ligase [Wenzhouxiangellaceae bacterium]